MKKSRVAVPLVLVLAVGLPALWIGFVGNVCEKGSLRGVGNAIGGSAGGQQIGSYLHDDRNKGDRKAIEDFLKGFGEPIEISESNPVTVNGAQFVLVAQTNWKPGKASNPNEPVMHPMVAPIEIQLRITNVSDRDLIFPIRRALGLKITDPWGKEVQARRVQSGESPTRPLQIPSVAFYSICPRVDLRWNEETKTSYLIFRDGTGSELLFGPFRPGRYKLAVSYMVASEDHEKPKARTPLVWLGSAVTAGVFVNVLEGTIRGRSPARDRYAPDNSSPIIVCASEPVTVHNARFVVVAQADWKPEKNKPVPVELQLHINNLDAADRLFPTFDSFGVVLTDTRGISVMSLGGRNGTAFTRPILIPAGASFALAARGGPPGTGSPSAELRWPLERMAGELVYCDGTGSSFVIGPLSPGQYNVSFSYGASELGPLKTKRGHQTWLGTATTRSAVVKVFPN